MSDAPAYDPRARIESMDKLVASVLATLEARGTEPELPTGLTLLDEAIWGLHRSELTVLAGRPGEGKCLGLGTPVLMADGTTKPVEAIRVGEALMGPDSLPRRVTSVTTGEEALYEIQQRNGLWYTVNASHILSLKRGGRQVRNLCVTDYLAKSAKFKHQHKGYKVPVEFPARPVPMPPYILGIWLGDGTSREAALSNTDEVVVTEWVAYGEALGLHVTQSNRSPRCPTYRLSNGRGGERKRNCVKQTLDALGVLGKDRKHIPDLYLRNSRAIRLELLAGLLDTDGAINNHGLIFYNTNERLAEQVCWLARTLGFRAQLSRYTARLKSRNYTCPAYKVTVGGTLSQIPLRVAYKRRGDSTTHTGLATNFKVVPKGVGRYYGFTLHHPDGLFLLGDCTVTHNTACALQISLHLADLHKRVLFLSLEMTREQITERMLIQLTQCDAWNLRRGGGLADLKAKLVPLEGFFKDLPLRLIDGTGYTAEQVRHILQQMVEQGGGVPDVLVVDFVQLASIEQGQSPPQAIQEYLRALKEVAMRYRIAVLALSQLNRESTKAAKGRPRLEHLKGAGAIEELADCAILCWWEQLGTEERPEGTKYWLLVEKQRNGPAGAQIPVRFKPETLTFESVEPVVSPWQAASGTPEDSRAGRDD